MIGLWIILKNSNKNFFQEIAFRFKHFLRFNILEFTLLSFIFLYLLSSITGRLNIGYRHLFPIFPLIYILAAVTLRSFWKKLNTDKQKKTFGWLIFSLIFLTIFETAVSFPYYMSYFNEFAGGPKNGYHYVTDSNADWGQDLKKLGIWIDDYNSCAQEKCNPNKKAGCSLICYSIANPFPTPNQPIEKINVDYFGMADLNYYLGNTYQPWWGAKRPLEPGWYAISTLFLQESIYSTDKKDEESYRWTKKIQPIHQVGTSIMIYYLTVQDIANLQL